MNEKHSEMKIFCISMQRSGTTSVGDYLQAHGLQRAGWPSSSRRGWTRSWMLGEYEDIFLDEEFLQAQILEDDPWWCPDFFKVLASRFPAARFVLLERDPDAWFESLCTHSHGRNPGMTDTHCKIYGREEELRRLESEGVDVTLWNLLDITGMPEYYKAAYRRHTRSALEFFASMPHRLFFGQLEDPTVFSRMLSFLGLTPNPAVPPPCSNPTTEKMRTLLNQYRSARASQAEQASR